MLNHLTRQTLQKIGGILLIRNQGNLMKLVLAAVVLLNSIHAEACSDFMWQWDENDWVKGSDAIYHGIVVSMSLSQESINDGETDPLLNVIALRGEKHITFKVFETLKGRSQRLVKAVLSECIGGVAEFGDTGLLFQVGDVWHMKPNAGNWATPIAAKVLKLLSTKKRTSEQ